MCLSFGGRFSSSGLAPPRGLAILAKSDALDFASGLRFAFNSLMVQVTAHDQSAALICCTSLESCNTPHPIHR